MGHHIKTTHYSRMQNEFDTFTKHRCYMFSNQCVCECVDAPEYADHTGARINRHQDGTIQGNKAGIPKGHKIVWSEHKDRFFEHGHLGRITGQSVFKAKDKFWKPPAYFISKAEIEGIKKCCSKTDIIHTADPTFPNCAEVRGADDVMIKMHLAEITPTITNIQIKKWLGDHGCLDGSVTVFKAKVLTGSHPIMTP